ncbi:hypothetical protein BAUCODRAFT_412418 [Baudoinia panamericana UAMH 10762]|uniref:Uncharacterized protein n=1 Tax=Baudoinia panamericana (strain UAMH 10762) TaxID=717646 RepID=M2LU61_BAUPA|nr:uncharacterized protein BAUCODRAFT_412418 [Baudoinia panamericana UAMH 10762]EMC98077.1 hypothetical protein BAUCODRAFT_412418 [Baudoinia panamericana UAMH 10762]
MGARLKYDHSDIRCVLFLSERDVARLRRQPSDARAMPRIAVPMVRASCRACVAPPYRSYGSTRCMLILCGCQTRLVSAGFVG